MKTSLSRGAWLITFLAAAFCSARVEATVNESAREIPIAKEVDVLVVGGSAGAVTAASAAAEAGARVFLIAPRSYLGEDLCAPWRLWLEEGEEAKSPLERAMFTAQAPEAEPPAALDELVKKDPHGLAFKYVASAPSVTPHKDTEPPSKLSDGRFALPNKDSVQFNGDVTITADTGIMQETKAVRLVVFSRPDGDFTPASVTVETSVDGKSWTPAGTFKPSAPVNEVALVEAPLARAARYVRLHVKRADDAKRLLLGELMISGSVKGDPTVAMTAVAPAQANASEPPTRMATPMQVKRALDEALLAAKVEFLFSSYPTDLVLDEAGKPCGVVMANRTGRQAILAKVIIDATPRAVVARMAGAQFEPYPSGEQTFYRVVVGGEVCSGKVIVSCRKVGQTVKAVTSNPDKKNKWIQAEVREYTLRLPMKDGSFAAFAAADQAARDATWQKEQVDASETLFQVPPDAMRSVKAAAGEWRGAASAELEAFRPAGVERIYVLGGCAEVSRAAAAKLLRPFALMEMGKRIGAAAAAEAKPLSPAKGPRIAAGTAVREAKDTPVFRGEVKEFLCGLRPTQKKTAGVPSEKRGLPVLGMYDVVVVGGGTGGAPAGIGAGRGGAKALLIEYQYGLGGVGTLGRISSYYHGYRGGYTAEVDKGVAELTSTNRVVREGRWEVEPKVEYWRRTNRKVGTDIWYGVLGCGALVEDGAVKGVVVATPEGRGVVMAKTVIDATGNADVAAAAGAQCTYTDDSEISVQGTGLPPLKPGVPATNTDYTFSDDTDVVDFWHTYVLARQRFKDAFDLGQLVDTRERRRIVGDVCISPMDIILGRTFPDALVLSKSNFDSHGFTVHPFFVAMPPDKDSLSICVPMRALLPKGLDGILVTGLGVSAHRDAMPVIRMQPDIQNQGYACGYAAAMVANTASTIRQVDMKELQKHLAEIGILPKEALSFQDSFPLPRERIAAAVAEVTKTPEKSSVDGVIRNRDALAVIFAQPQDSVPLLEKAYVSATGEARLAYAHILSMLGSPKGAPALLEYIKGAANFDTGWNYKGMGQFGRSLSELDSYIVALSRTRHPQTFDVVAAKARTLDAKKEFSHHRACAMAFETIADKRAAEILFEILRKPEMTGHATVNMDQAQQQMLPGGVENVQRNESLRELVLARALYRCGDKDGLGEKILKEYATDLRGHYARHAQAVLDAGKLVK